ncbi:MULTISPECIES: Cu(I)-responsive transcriptional regulator [Shewanella]|jgi:Cu(I)-responsive transcriptional regulator|uniref:HTH-type transcriptional regulator CueR n=1 Tax=Shewanella fodinae TaxID=552357 RepID=A0A4R2F9G9_9GAMM|nr:MULTISPECIES: Cu(I)-responsive transcriptional regulator [Shewanella]MDN5369316.1 MerR family transcriptional regulator, copper efflux regulator [Shewanella sp.]MBO1272963.1 Cu(I)-responsive transcriptional regulator [Shewanella sp. 4t3-1-2LB]MCL2907780.1 Cu(I)-responsive transcriptional regulator [Shewanella fodinae]TCN81136.1 Cu(I)-responsive transcriptional regulator [Shewanella fodinae]GGZ10566.1 MerR family transcriptional regulator [Shewanella fodinae]
MKIGDVAKATGLSIKSIRYYHDIGLVQAERGDNGYREYNSSQLEALQFVQHCRELGFSIEECKDLLQLKHDPQRCASDVKRLASEHLKVLEQRMASLADLHAELSELVNQCHGGDSPDCPIIEGLSGKSCCHH